MGWMQESLSARCGRSGGTKEAPTDKARFEASKRSTFHGPRVLNNLSAIYAENNLNKTSTSLQTVLQQLSSGSKINSGADDAAGLSLVNGLEANSTALTQSETNATEGVGCWMWPTALSRR